MLFPSWKFGYYEFVPVLYETAILNSVGISVIVVPLVTLVLDFFLKLHLQIYYL